MYFLFILLPFLCLGCSGSGPSDFESTLGYQKNRDTLLGSVTLHIEQNHYALENTANHFSKSDLLILSEAQMTQQLNQHSPDLHLEVKETGIHKIYCAQGSPQGDHWREYSVENQQLRIQLIEFGDALIELAPGSKFRFSCWATQENRILFSSIELNLGILQKGRIVEQKASGQIVLSNPTRSSFIVACQQNQNSAPQERFVPLGLLEEQAQMEVTCRTRIAWLSVPLRCQSFVNSAEGLRNCWQGISDQDVQWIQVEVVGGQ